MTIRRINIKRLSILLIISILFTLASDAFVFTIHAEVPTPTGYWKLDETSGTTAYDSSGNNLNGTLNNGPVWVPGIVGNCLEFDGSNDYINLGNPAALQFTGAMTVSAWVYTDSYATSGRIISKDNGASSRSWSLHLTTGGKGVFQIAENATTIVNVETTTAIPKGEWTHIAGIYEPGSTLHIYINGVENNSNSILIPSAQYSNTGNVYIGRRPDNSYAFDGKIDEVYAFGSALSSTDIAELALLTPTPTVTPTPTITPTPTPTPTASPVSSLIIDNGDAGYSETGVWLDSGLTGYNGSSTRYTNTVGLTAKWEAVAPQTGNYDVYVWYPYHSNSATSVNYTMTTNQGLWTSSTDQTQNAGQWYKISTISVDSGSNMSVVLTALTTKSTRADAVKFESTTNTPSPTATPTPTPTPTPTLVPTEASFVPSFESISVYVPGEGSDSTIQLSYRKAGTSTWLPAFPPVYDETYDQFRGSIVKLEEDTAYEVQAEIYKNEEIIKTVSETVATWTSNPVISQTLSLSSIYSGGALQLDGYVGADNGWIKIINDTDLVVDGQKLETAAVKVTNSHYLILENFIVRGGSRHGIMLNNSDTNIRIINADISGWGREVVATTETGDVGQPVDSEGNEINNDAGIAIYDGYNIVVERSYIHEPNGWANAWGGVSMGGQTFTQTHPEGPNAVFLRGKGGIVLRYNDFIGSDAHRYNDVVESYYNENKNGGPYKDADIYGNYLGFGNDDAMELDGGQMNIRFYNNRNEQTYCGLSIVPNMLGPSYVFNNISFNMGDSRGSGGGAVVKGGGNQNLGLGWSFLFNNTYYTKSNGFAAYQFQSRRDMKAYTRNNIIILTRSVATGVNNIRDDYMRQENSFDYDALGNTTTSDGYGGITAFEGNEANGQWGLAALTNPLAGLFTLKTTTEDKEVNVIDKGIAIPNFTDGYAGLSPDIGAFEYGESSLFPKRPISLTADKYMVRISGDSDTGTFTISPGTYSGAYSIRKAASDDWYTVTPTNGTFTAGEDITFTITLDRNKASFDKSYEYSTLFVRLPNGYSVPISVTGISS